MYGLAVVDIGIGVLQGDGRCAVEDVRGISARCRDAGHAGGVIEIGDGAKSNWNGGGASTRRTSVVLGALVKNVKVEEGSESLLVLHVQGQHDKR